MLQKGFLTDSQNRSKHAMWRLGGAILMLLGTAAVLMAAIGILARWETMDKYPQAIQLMLVGAFFVLLGVLFQFAAYRRRRRSAGRYFDALHKIKE